ncbi:ComF family protein [Dawidia soli]|uniref:ComF family protein n=1 Tax=Dawidia soli TaxID=2782352 RepID=A0AAP2GBI5_9BACT|nr:ComF family protein [Dawidia soli]MBT1685189.1 ComF family protein [Dawidia soli]
MANSLESVFSDFVSLFFPRLCAACTQPRMKGEPIICSACLLELPYTDHHIDPQNLLYQRLSAFTPVHTAQAFLKFSKDSRVQRLLYALKYGHQPDVGNFLGELYGARLSSTGMTTKPDLVVPIPLHPSRQRKRGYNQSACFAAGMASTLNIPCAENLVERTVKTITQTRKNRLERWENMQNVFRVKVSREIAGKDLLLVDDVVTTGATLEACVRALTDAGCGAIHIACIAAA